MQKKILLIHEDPHVCDSLRQAFVSYGYSVLQLRKTDDASDLIQNENPDAVIVAPDLIKDDIKALLEKVNGRAAKTSTVPLVVPAPVEASSPESAKAAAPNLEAAEKLKQFQNLFLAVKAKYARGLPQKIEELGRDIQAAMDQPEETDPLEQVRQVAHKMVGTAGSYGYEKFSCITAIALQCPFKTRT